MNKSRRQLMLSLATLPAVAMLSGTSVEAEAKPLTKASIAKSLLVLADKAEAQGFTLEAQAILDAALVVLGKGKGALGTVTSAARKAGDSLGIR